MQINSMNQASFKGLWRGPLKTTELGKDSRCKHGNIYKQTFEYCPFKDESNDEAIKTAMKVNRSIFALDDTRDDDAYGPEAYYIPEVKIGEILNFTADDYETMKELKPEVYQSSADYKFTTLSTAEAGRLLNHKV